MPTVLLDPITQNSTRLEEPVGTDLEIEDFKLELANSSGVNAIMARDIVLDAVLDRTMEGASNITVTLHDPLSVLLNSGAFDRAVDIYIDGMWWRLVAVNKADSDLDLVFEDRDVTYVRKHDEVVKGNRKDMTRAEFCVRLLKRVKLAQFDPTTKFLDPFSAEKGITIVCPELHKTQPKKNGKKEKKEVKERKREAGIFNDGTLYIWHARGTAGPNYIPKNSGVKRWQGSETVAFSVVKAKNDQIQNAEDILDEASRLKCARKVMIACLASGMVESGLQNLDYGDRDSVGVFQQRPSQGWKGLRDVTRAANEWLVRGKMFYEENPNYSWGEITSKVQMNGAIIPDYVAKVNSAAHFAAKFVDAYGGGFSITTVAYRKKFVFSTASGGKKEDWWTAIGRILSEVGWARFMSNGVCYIIAEKDLLKSKIRMRLSESTPGVNRINFNYDIGQKIATATVSCRASRWVAPPGSVVQLADCGPASGRWLVSTISRSLYDRDCTITLKKPEPKLSEPQADLVLRESIDEWITRNHLAKRGDPVEPGPRDSIFSGTGTDAANQPIGRTGKVIVSPGANYPGQPIKEDLMIFLRLVAGMTNESIVVGTGTAHGVTVNGGRSNHQWPWAGAADLSVDGDARYSDRAHAKGNNIAIAVMRVCGLSYREAKQRLGSGLGDRGWDLGGANFSWRGHSVEIGWLTLSGGNHFNHVHVGFEWGT